MPRPTPDLLGRRFGRLTVTSRVLAEKGPTRWVLTCECGNQTQSRADNLLSGGKLSCGCTRWKRPIKPGRDSRIYTIWSGIKQRTGNQSCKEFQWYGARGITMHAEWANSFDAFYEYVLTLAVTGSSIDRVDNNGGYVPGNLRWATQHDQTNNTRANRLITACGRSQNLSQWARDTGIDQSLIAARISKLGWTPERAVTTPPRPMKRRGAA